MTAVEIDKNRELSRAGLVRHIEEAVAQWKEGEMSTAGLANVVLQMVEYEAFYDRVFGDRRPQEEGMNDIEEQFKAQAKLDELNTAADNVFYRWHEGEAAVADVVVALLKIEEFEKTL